MKDDDNIWEVYKVLRKHRSSEKKSARDLCISKLIKANIHYTTNNDGIHCVVEGPECYIDYWPGTGRWHARNGHKGFGINNLIAYIKQSPA